ncbi:MAG: chromosome segregation protein SMC, partial [Victivallales bacterium]
IVMTAAIGGVGFHPRFLIHDGPRVSDLAATIFRYYFSFARELELLANNEPNFQYIITTTEAPPQELQVHPWLICKLDATNAESRLLKCNL